MDDVVVDYVRAGLTPYMVEHLYRGAALRGCGVADYCLEAGYDPRLVMALARRWNIRTDNTPRMLIGFGLVSFGVAIGLVLGALLRANDEPEQPFISESTGNVKPIRERREQWRTRC